MNLSNFFRKSTQPSSPYEELTWNQKLAAMIVARVSMCKILVLLVVAICPFYNVKAQSPELRASYNQVCKTLKEYKFSSEDAHNGHPEGRTTGIQFKIQNNSLVFVFTDDFGHFADPFCENKQGTKTVTVSISNARFQITSWLSSYMSITAKEHGQVDYVYKKQKEIIDEYKIYGTKGTLEKLMSELDNLLNLLREEGFNGTLVPGGQTTSKKTPQKSNNLSNGSNKKNVGKYVQ